MKSKGTKILTDNIKGCSMGYDTKLVVLMLCDIAESLAIIADSMQEAQPIMVKKSSDMENDANEPVPL